ncbi:MAG: hypothetical protein ABIW03_05445, partial [Sphingomicrobium sp.]
ANFPKGTPVTIEQVRSDPMRWDGQWIQVEGWMDRCSRLDCILAERPRSQGMSLSFAGGESFDQWTVPLLPAKVVVVARLRSECLVSYCTDRAPVLNQPFVMTLLWNVNDPGKEP